VPQLIDQIKWKVFDVDDLGGPEYVIKQLESYGYGGLYD
jgi:hypothetical protein